MAYSGWGDPTESSAQYQQYAKDVAAMGGLAVRLGAQTGHEGQFGARFPKAVIVAKGLGEPLTWTTGQMYGYYLAPASLLARDFIQGVGNKAVIVTGKAAETAENAAKAVTGLGMLAGVALLVAVALPVFLASRKK